MAKGKFKSRTETPQQEEGGPHSSSLANADTYEFMMARYSIPPEQAHRIRVQDGHKPKEEWKCAIFCFPLRSCGWPESTYVVSFHQNSLDFTKELKDILRDLEFRGILKRR
jgi:hypothetical protein